ncbi:hypothetical protein D3C72_1722640 [compost metagenome]
MTSSAPLSPCTRSLSSFRWPVAQRLAWITPMAPLVNSAVMVKLSLASRSYSPMRLPGALSKVLSRAKTWSISVAAPKPAKSRMWMPTSPSTPLEPCLVDSRHSHWLSVAQSPQALDTSQLCR